MKKELAESLRHMRANPTTGTAHNQQLISTQVETIFAIDELKDSIQELNKTVEKSAEQGRKLEESNYKLQKVMVFFTAITTTIISFPVLVAMFNFVAHFPIAFGLVISAIISLFVGLTTFSRLQVKSVEKIKVKERIKVEVK